MRSRERENAMNSDFRDKLSNAATVVEITLGIDVYKRQPYEYLS